MNPLNLLNTQPYKFFGLLCIFLKSVEQGNYLYHRGNTIIANVWLIFAISTIMHGLMIELIPRYIVSTQLIMMIISSVSFSIIVGYHGSIIIYNLGKKFLVRIKNLLA